MENKVQITLSGVQQTLLIPLWGASKRTPVRLACRSGLASRYRPA